MGTSGQGAYQGGRRPKGAMGILHLRDTGCFAFRIGDMVTDSEDGEGPGQFSVQVRAEDHGDAAAAREGRELVIPFVGGSN